MKKSQFLEEAILADLQIRNFQKNDEIPSRNQLASKYHCSRTTVERAVTALKRRGILTSSQGAPTRVLNLAPSLHNGEITDIWLIAADLSVYTQERLREMFLPGADDISIHTVRNETILKQLDLLASPRTALVWLMPGVEYIGLIRFFNQKNIPQLLINRDYEQNCYACTDSYESIREGLAWLMIEAGRRIALVTRRPNLAQPYHSERLLAFYENAMKLGAVLEPEHIHVQDFMDIPKEMSELGLRLFGASEIPRGIVVLESRLTLPLVTCGLIYGRHPGKDYYLLTYDEIPELKKYAGIAMMRQQDEKLFLETKRWILDGFAVRNTPFKTRIKTELIRPPSC